MNSATTKQDTAVTKGAEVEPERSLPAVAFNTFDEMERMFERLMPRGWMRPFRWDWPMANEMVERRDLRLKVPAVDVIDQEEAVVVRAELPGFKKEDIDVSTTENTLTIKAKARSEKKEERQDYFRCEISQSATARTIALPSSVDPAHVKAKLKDGILEVTMTKIDGARRRPVPIE